MAVKYEHKRVPCRDDSVDRVLAECSAEGWELVSTNGDYRSNIEVYFTLFFKREASS